jgi:hypothetical protein
LSDHLGCCGTIIRMDEIAQRSAKAEDAYRRL